MMKVPSAKVDRGRFVVFLGLGFLVYLCLILRNEPSLAAGYYNIGLVRTAPGWTTVQAPVNNLVGRSDACNIWTGTDLIVWGGRYGSTNSNVKQDGAFYNATTNSFYVPNFPAQTAITTTGAPAARSLFVCAWTGTKLIVWSGANASVAVINTGGVYDSVAGTWSAMTTTNAPVARSDNTYAYWTGATGVSATQNRMITWGGYVSSSTGTNTGGLYDPATDIWTTITTTGAPAARYYHSIVWTGATGNSATENRLIVWGGKASSYYNDGAIYDAATNSWSAVTSTNAPVARSVATSIWTGSKMVIWGGKNSSGTAINDGALYDIATNSWTTMTSTGAPSVRSYLNQDNVAMGTDNKVLIWGGYNSPTYLNSGAIYDIATNSWTTMLTNNLPAARSDASMAWDATNSRLIYWGGYLTGTTYSSTMAFYYPQ